MKPSESPSESVVSIQGLVKHYGAVEAVRGIDLEVRRGEVFGFLGPNGAGKSTTIRCLLGLLRPTAGRVTAFGLDATRDGVAVRRRLAYVPGELRLPERVTGRTLVGTMAALRGRVDDRRRDELAERLRFDLDRPVGDLSTGNRRKLALLLAFLADTELLVLDEPTNGLDPLMQREFLALVAEAKARRATVFLSSHVLSEVQRAADRVAVLRGGKLIASGTVDELRRRARQRVEVWFEGPAPETELADVAGLVDRSINGSHVAATLAGPIAPLLAVLARHPVLSMLVEEPDLEEAFLGLYEGAA
ncbi:MAG TPA: ABC transporter ATP-binding protein [Candidatus Limnocylindrales bacterium]|nr:ABC transporter ATP-binding protein [Candidatus Limnocylindrales bacterium]